MTNKEYQNFVRFFSRSERVEFLEKVYAPCIMLFYPIEEGIRYCHFDENNLSELKSFVDSAKLQGFKQMGFFGGWGSKNVLGLIKYMDKKKVRKMTDKHFVDFPPIKKIGIKNDKINFISDIEKRIYSFDEIQELWTYQ